MKKISRYTGIIMLAVMLLLTLKSCIKDSGKMSYTYYTPIVHTSASVRASIKNDIAQPIQNPGKIYIIGTTIFLAEKEKGIHIIDYSNPSSPVNKGFIFIPGNEDMAINNNILYADCYTDLMAIDISNLNHIVLKNYAANIYPERSYINGYSIDSGFVVTDWIKRDTVINAGTSPNPFNYYGIGYTMLGSAYSPAAANTSSSGSSATGTGTSGSMSKLTILNNHLYTIDSYNLLAFNISNPASPALLNSTNLHLGIGETETIYPFQDKLFIGSTTGMFILSIANPDNPTLLTTFTHATACDPVITDGKNAYITLHSGTVCSGIKNELEIVNISDILNPVLSATYPMTQPYGLSKDSNTLFVCDDVLKIYDASNANALTLLQSIPMNSPYDIICQNGIAIVTAADGLYMLNYSNPSETKILSKLPVISSK